MTGSAKCLIWLWILVLICLTGCSDPCGDLAARTCAKVGASDALCVQLRAVAAHPSAADQQACKHGQTFIDELERR